MTWKPRVVSQHRMPALFRSPLMRQFIAYVSAGLPQVYLQAHPALLRDRKRKRIARVLERLPDQSLKKHLSSRLQAIERVQPTKAPRGTPQRGASAPPTRNSSAPRRPSSKAPVQSGGAGAQLRRLVGGVVVTACILGVLWVIFMILSNV